MILILGLANLLADGFSMAASNYSGVKAQKDDYARLRAMELRHIASSPEGEREEVRHIFAAKGFEGHDLERAVDVITGSKERWIRVMLEEEHGVPRVSRSPVKAGLFTFIAFVACGSVPLLPFLVGNSINTMIFATLATGCVFFGIGAMKSRWSTARWWLSGFETLSIGMTAAGVAYAVGALLKGFSETAV